MAAPNPILRDSPGLRNLSGATSGFPCERRQMENNQTDFDRLLAGQVAPDDPALGRVAAFLDQVQASQTMPDVQQLADPHLRLMRQATKLETTESHHPHQSRSARRSRRIFIGAVAGILAGITAGVGVAAASGTQGPPWISWLPWTAATNSAGASSGSSMTPPGSPSNGQSPSRQSGAPAVTVPLPTTVPSEVPPHATSPAADPSKSDKRVADPSKGIIPSATNRGKSSAAPGHTKTAAPPSAKPTSKDRASEVTNKVPDKAPKG